MLEKLSGRVQKEGRGWGWADFCFEKHVSKVSRARFQSFLAEASQSNT